MFSLLGKLPALWPILKNIGFVIDFFRTMQVVLVDVSKRPTKIPSCEETRLILRSTRELLERGIIDVPGVDELEIAKILGQIEERVVCAVDKTHRDYAKLEESTGISMAERV